ncbi:hypothetical protein [Rhizobium sp. BK376]|uniref:COG3904 family protein n=1 Tax=Rhizobium sp. BK376 TaxID=2512149 RepID=UPI0010443849|nr:hypothetical protein [Rhizobium sp. BK376]TCR78702.1 hypothetical protein EV561_11776 [Rhizobium sp. BK376]
MNLAIMIGRPGVLVVTGLLIFALLLAPLLTADLAFAEAPGSGQRPMDFILVHSGDCKEACIEWVSAEGKISADTPKLFAALLKSLNGRKLPIVIQSGGGDVNAALAVGRMIRKAGLETEIGRTQLKDCPTLNPRCQETVSDNDWSEGVVRAGGAYCLSACPFLFAGGSVRVAARNAYLGVHQITTVRQEYEADGSKRKIVKETTSTKLYPALRRELAVYFDQMGISNDVFAMIASAIPQDMHIIQTDDALKSGLLTKVSTDGELGVVVCGSAANAQCQQDSAGKLRTPANLGSVQSERTTRAPEGPYEDKSCYDVNRAYESTHDAGRHLSKIYGVPPDGPPKLRQELQAMDGYIFARSGSGIWKRSKRTVVRTTLDDRTGQPIFTACRYQGVEDINGEHALRYWALWRRHGWEAFVNVWISKSSGRNVQVLSHYRQGLGESSYPVELETESYDRGTVLEPEDLFVRQEQLRRVQGPVQAP